VRARFAFLDHPGPIAFAHRGGSAEGPENTVASFAHAISLGYRYLETDVHATSDGVVAVIHDPMLDRVSDRQGLVSSLSWPEVAGAELTDGQRVPRFDELLERWPAARWNVDAKSDAVVEPLAEVIRRADAVERVCVTSFSDARLRRIRTLVGPDLCTGMGPRSLTALRFDGVLPFFPCRPNFQAFGACQVPVRWGPLTVIDRRFVDHAHHLGLGVHAWTIDAEQEMHRLLDLGVDGIMTDHPSRLRQVLLARQQWVEP
jgi:glycerophosphoryl diester phosphodiesterase